METESKKDVNQVTDTIVIDEFADDDNAVKTFHIFNQLGVSDLRKANGLKVDYIFTDNSQICEIINPPDSSISYYGGTLIDLKTTPLKGLKLNDKAVPNEFLNVLSDNKEYKAYVLDQGDSYYFCIYPTDYYIVID